MNYRNMIIEDEFFTYVRIEEEVYLEKIINEFGDLSRFSNEFNLDFIICKYDGILNFNHISKVKYLDNILRYGLKESSGDFGIGVYVIPSDDSLANDNLKTYISEMFSYDDNDILVVNGIYRGEYYKCVYGSGKEGYCLIESNNIPISNYNIVEMDDYLLN